VSPEFTVPLDVVVARIRGELRFEADNSRGHSLCSGNGGVAYDRQLDEDRRQSNNGLLTYFDPRGRGLKRESPSVLLG